MTPAPVLILGVGNPSRGDDALGPALVERLEQTLSQELARGEVELLTDFQLQPEHALDLVGRARVFIVDASVSAPAPFAVERVMARAGADAVSHAMSPAALLSAFERALGERPPPTWVLAIRGERFELGEELTPRASSHLDAALAHLSRVLREPTAGGGGRRIEIEGTVQGVGFRPWVHRTASRLGLAGSVWNTPRGVVIEAFGERSALDELDRSISYDPPLGASIRSLRSVELPPRETVGFSIAPSEGGPSGAAPLPADLATCDACIEETRDPSSRRFGYAFTACASCGPRLAVARALPWDRARTALGGFSPCGDCARERRDPDDRRFHAETLACPACGPRVWLADARGAPLASQAPIDDAARMIREGRVVGVQGVGAFHLCCDARDASAVLALRRRKRRDAQPFAVMVASVAEAQRVARLDEALRAALGSPARPIVLAETLPDAPIAADAVNGGARRTGLMLPYSPLHDRLARACGGALVVTSANVHGGPCPLDHGDALRDLAGLVDAWVLHDRPMIRRVEDSVVARGHGGVRTVRRARGFAATPIRLPAASPVPILAVGAHLKSAACLVVDDLAYLTPHLGDLESLEAERSFAREVEGFEALLGVRAEVLAHDLHPDYASTRYAMRREATRRVAVQHHVAHALAALAEHRIDEPALALAFDGTGYGTDGTSWGGELLLVDGARWTRLSALRPLPLPGGERAIREVWRTALGALYDALGAEEARALCERSFVFQTIPRRDLDAVLRMLRAEVGSPRARGVGRYFDAVASLALGLRESSFDGHPPIALEEQGGGEAAPYPYALPSALALSGGVSAANELDLRPTLRAIVEELLGGATAAVISARFHASLIEASAALVARALSETGVRRVVLCGGAFQNRRLEDGLIARLGAARVVMAREAPLGDGGVALGQAWAATLALREERA